MVPDIKRLWKGFWQIADPKLWVASAMPMLAAFSLALHHRREEPLIITLFWFALAATAVFAVETGKNAINELVDFRIDLSVSPENITPFNAGKKTLTQGILKKRECALIAVLSYLFCGGAGALIVFFRSFESLYIGLLGVLLSVLYSLPPFKLCYRGFGEAAVGLSFGPVLMAGISLVISGKIVGEVMAASAVMGFFIAAVLWINEYPDYEADKAGGKRCGVVRVGREKAYIVYAAIFALGYISAAVMAIIFRRAEYLLPILTLPLAVRAVLNARLNFKSVRRLLFSNIATVKIYKVIGAAIIAAAIIKNFY